MSDADPRPTLFVRRMPTPRFLLYLFVVLGGLGMLGLLHFATATVDPESVGNNETVLIGFEAAFGIGLLVLLRRRSLGLGLGPAGMVIHGWFGRDRLPWEGVVALRANDSYLQVIGRHGGDINRTTVRANRRGRWRMADSILESAPHLARVAWSVGLPEREGVIASKAELPTKAWEDDGTLHIEGPGATKLEFEDSHPDHGRIRNALEHRLLPALLDRER